MQVRKVTSSIRRLFASLDIYYNTGINTEIRNKMKPR